MESTTVERHGNPDSLGAEGDTLLGKMRDWEETWRNPFLSSNKRSGISHTNYNAYYGAMYGGRLLATQSPVVASDLGRCTRFLCWLGAKSYCT